MDTTHSGTWPCEKCGAMFKSRAYLQKHTLIMHQKDEDKPHRFALDELIRGCVLLDRRPPLLKPN